MMQRTIGTLLAVVLVFCVPTMGAVHAQGYAAGAKGAVVIEAQSGRVLYEKNAHERLPMASTTKIMTALLALEQPELDVPFTVDSAAIYVEGSSMGLREGDVVTLRTLAVGMLLASGNDAANVAAVRIAGSTGAFVTKMNERAVALGMQNTSFETPSGLDGKAHYSTAYDMALLARVALQNESFAAICGQYRMAVEYGQPPYRRTLRNHNRLLSEYEGATGVKTGFTKAAGRCLVSSAQRNGVTLICVTLACPDDWRTHSALLSEAFARVLRTDLSSLLPQSIAVGGGEATRADITAAHTLTAVLSPEERERACVEVAAPPFLLAPVAAGQVVGEARVLLDGELLTSVPLCTAQAVPARPLRARPSLWERIFDRHDRQRTK